MSTNQAEHILLENMFVMRLCRQVNRRINFVLDGRSNPIILLLKFSSPVHTLESQPVTARGTISPDPYFWLHSVIEGPRLVQLVLMENNMARECEICGIISFRADLVSKTPGLGFS